MKIRDAFARSLREIRVSKQLAQEDFDEVSRTYVSMLERGLKSPTLDKIQELSDSLGVHPLTLLTLTYMKAEGAKDPKSLQQTVIAELAAIRKAQAKD